MPVCDICEQDVRKLAGKCDLCGKKFCRECRGGIDLCEQCVEPPEQKELLSDYSIQAQRDSEDDSDSEPEVEYTNLEPGEIHISLDDIE